MNQHEKITKKLKGRHLNIYKKEEVADPLRCALPLLIRIVPRYSS